MMLAENISDSKEEELSERGLQDGTGPDTVLSVSYNAYISVLVAYKLFFR